MEIFNSVDKFFSSINSYLTYNEIFVICAGLFLFTVVCVLITTSRSYEARLIKAVDMFNNYFLDSPNITEENLIPFNNRMKSKKVPKQLRKQWQQYVLYREEKASFYMSFENCVSTPLKNSSFKHSITVMNIVSYILAIVSLILNTYCSYEGNISAVLQHILLCPVLILVVNYIITIFLNFRHSAIISDLNQNYQYFEVNIDKATQTLPDYVDYEVLFDKNEIKHGIPILYAYLEKRAEEEKKELERSRLKNIEHEKFNFDEAGIESSLVLDRAMQEAENYINERKKCMEDMEQINSDITQQEMAYRDTTKEYQRQLQVSKETFQNFKQQLEEASSTIEANYIKKQQQQELDRQRNLERDFDTATDRHKKILESYQEELTAVEDTLKKAKASLEKSMLSEFRTYSGKVYDAVSKIVEEREEEKTDNLKAEIKGLEEKIVSKDAELDNIYEQNRVLNERLAGQPVSYVPQTPVEQIRAEEEKKTEQESQVREPGTGVETKDVATEAEPNQEESPSEEAEKEPYIAEPAQTEEPAEEETEGQDLEMESDAYDADVAESEGFDAEATGENNEDSEETLETPEDTRERISRHRFVYDTPNDAGTNAGGDFASEGENYFDVGDTNDQSGQDGNSIFNVSDGTFGGEDAVHSQDIFTIGEVESKAKKAGRPRKEVEAKPASNEQKRGRGRPKKVMPEAEAEAKVSEPKRGRGRPKKEQEESVTVPADDKPEVKKGRGRPRKETTKPETTSTTIQEESKKEQKQGRGRPKKADAVDETKVSDSGQATRRGRPKKADTQPATEANPSATAKRGRPKKEQPASEPKPEESTSSEATEPKRGRGRPKKSQSESGEEETSRAKDALKSATQSAETEPHSATSEDADIGANLEEIEDIDEFLKKIDEEIALENAKLEENQKELAKKARISRRRK